MGIQAMLDAIRKRTTGFVVKTLTGLLVISFAIWGIGDVVRGTDDRATAVTIGDTEIPTRLVGREFQQELRRLNAIFGGQLDTEQARSMGVVRSVLDRIIARTLYNHGAAELGLRVGDAEVLRDIHQNKAFQNALGAFDRERFNLALNSIGFNEAGYVATLKEEIIRKQFLESIVERGAVAPGSLVNPVYRYRQEKRVVETLQIPDSQFTDIGAADPAALQKYYQDNAKQFTAPEYRAVTFIGFTADELAKEIKVSDEAVRGAFEQRADEFQQPERRELLQIVMGAENKAAAAAQALKAGRAFAEVAKDVAGMAEDALGLGLVTRADLLPELQDAAFALKPGENSKPVKSPLGWHILRLKKIEPAASKTLADVRGALAKDLAREMAVDGLFKLANKLEDELGGGATLEEAASRLNLRKGKIPAIDRSGRDAAGKAVAGIPAGAGFLDVVFSTEETQESPLTESGSDGYFIVRVDRVTAPALRPLDSVRDQVTKGWRQERSRDAARKEAEKLLKQVQAGGDITGVSKAQKLVFKTTKPFTRLGDAASQGIPPDLAAKIFALKTGGAALGRDAGGYVIARLTKVIPADPASAKETAMAIKKDLAASISSDLLVQLVHALRNRYPVIINQRAVDSL